MLTTIIIDLIEANAQELSKKIQQSLLTHPSTYSYRHIDEKTLFDWIYDVCSRFGYWLEQDTETGELEQHYRNLGKERFKQNFMLAEVVSALYITKRQLWEFIAAGREVDSTLNLNQIVETSLLLVGFFDHAVFHVTKGYEEMFQERYGYVAPLQQPELLTEAIEAKRKREELSAAEPVRQSIFFTGDMSRLERQAETAGRQRVSPSVGRRWNMKAGIIFTGTGPILILTTYESFQDGKFVEKLQLKGIKKFIAYEVPLDIVQQKYGQQFDAIMKDVKQTDDLRVLDFDGHKIFYTFSFADLGKAHLHEAA